MYPATLHEFLTNESQQKYLADALSLFADICAAAANAKGFHADEARLRELLYDNGAKPEDLEWFENTVFQAEIGRIMSEGGEAIEAVRKSLMDDHLDDVPGPAAEIADILIRCGDTAAKRYDDIGQVVVRKLLYNATRPHKHGKNS